VVVFGSSGVWIPLLVKRLGNSPFDKVSFLQNFTTYFIAIIGSGCIDLIIRAIQHNKKNPVGPILFFILILFISLFLVGLIFFWIQNGIGYSSLGVFCGVILAYILWWFSNWKSEKLNPYDALGGVIE
jgi:O-antigen/teichoic acid export membrane protein